jgi:3-hydroxy-9,10-secoandrosta-1,3,5(10)-triene-9,17-dione monooxygenase reductase component
VQTGETVIDGFAAGVAVITARDFLGRPVGATVNSPASLSLAPPLVTLRLSPTSRALEALRQQGGFAVNILCEDQQSLAELFSQPGSAGDWPEGDLLAADLPHLEGTLTVVECSVREIINGGDHDVVLGTVRG